jgi:pimeloyl-ACP methyl ester carboxylesterase
MSEGSRHETTMARPCRAARQSLEALATGALWARACAGYLYWLVKERPPRRAGRVQAGDAAIFYRIYGSGDPVLLLHGGFMMAEAWFAQIPALARRHLVVTPDSRGHGRSGSGAGPITYRRMAEDAACLIRELGLAPAHVVGWSDGGTTALALAMQEPGLVRSLVLLGTPYNTSNYSPEALLKMEDLLRPRSPETLALRALRGLLNPERGSWPDFAARMGAMWRELPDFTAEELASIKAPTLVVACDRDEFLSAWPDPLKVFRETAEAIPGARMESVRGGKHAVLLQRPRRINHLILGFLDSA